MEPVVSESTPFRSLLSEPVLIEENKNGTQKKKNLPNGPVSLS